VSRPLRPKRTAALAVVPATVTHLNAPAVLGLEPRSFRDFLKKHRVRHWSDGQLVMARVDDVLVKLDELSARQGPASDCEADGIGADDPAVDTLLCRLGRARVSPRRGSP